jgi:tetraacyldisaccharide-1-P 4'-kinase
MMQSKKIFHRNKVLPNGDLRQPNKSIDDQKVLDDYR